MSKQTLRTAVTIAPCTGEVQTCHEYWNLFDRKIYHLTLCEGLLRLVRNSMIKLTLDSYGHHQNKLKAIVVNCDGLFNKLPQLETLIDLNKPDIVIGTESHQNSSILTAEITPPGFITYRKDRIQGKKGGVFVMVRDTFIATECNVNTTDAELLWVEIHIQGEKPLFIGSFYRPPESPPVNIKRLSDSIAEIQSMHKNAVLIIGVYLWFRIDLHADRRIWNACQYKNHCRNWVYNWATRRATTGSFLNPTTFPFNYLR